MTLKLQDFITKSVKVVFFTGAGISTNSGIPDFRGRNGFWNSSVMKKSSMNYRDIARPKFFKNLPSRAWGFYGKRIDLYRTTTPHHGFEILKQW